MSTTVRSWWSEREIYLGWDRKEVSRLWHCFGASDEHRVDMVTALEMLAVSQANILPINTHRLTSFLDPSHLLIGHGRLTWTRFRQQPIYESLIPCLNINLQTTTEKVVRKAQDARHCSGIDLLKLEVLDTDMARSRDEAVINATATLIDDGFTVMPLISANVLAAEELQALGCPVLRVMGSPIGSGRGIEWPGIVQEICELGVPVILDGGIGSSEDCLEAMRLGCAGFLVNSMLWRYGTPVATLQRLTESLEELA